MIMGQSGQYLPKTTHDHDYRPKCLTVKSGHNWRYRLSGPTADAAHPVPPREAPVRYAAGGDVEDGDCEGEGDLISTPRTAKSTLSLVAGEPLVIGLAVGRDATPTAHAYTVSSRSHD